MPGESEAECLSGGMAPPVFNRFLELHALWKAANRDLDEFEGEG